MTMYTIGSLFAGIGGLDLAAEWAGFITKWQSDHDEYCTSIQNTRFPHARQHRCDVRELRGSTLAPVDVVCGGPPCQPFSRAGKRRGAADDRHLWPEMLRVIRELNPQPRAVFFENVTGSVDLLLAEVLADLDAAGYSAIWPFVLPVAAFGSPHIRRRVFIVAYTDSQRQPQPQGCESEFGRWPLNSSERNVSLGDTHQAGLAGRKSLGENIEPQQPPAERADNSTGRRPALPRLGIGVDELPAWMVRPTWPAWRGQPQYDWEPPRTVETYKGRADRVAAIGNAVSPVQAYPFWFALMAELQRQDDQEHNT